ncbi:hypothetical protein GW17_00022665 [Ensete ventricosum]|nr:hypothetical protein GW17_00022665 [Ensete ventricosum]
MIEHIEESEEDDLEPEEENTKEDPQPADCMTHTLAGHVNPQAMKDEESLKQQLVTILIKTRSPNDPMNGKVKQVTLHGKRGSEEKTQRREVCYLHRTEPISSYQTARPPYVDLTGGTTSRYSALLLSTSSEGRS